MAVADIASGKYEIGRVATRTFQVIRANFVPFFALGLIATIPTTIYVVLMTSGLLPSTMTGGNARTVTLYFAGAFGSLAIGSFFSLVLQATLTYGAISYLSNQPVALGRAFGIGLRQFFPLLGIGFLEALGLMGGFLLLVVPGFMLYVAWCMVVPVRIAEHTRVVESFGRSRALTAGFRWPIFGTLIVFFFGAGIAQNAIRPLIAVSSVSAISVTTYIGVVITALVTAIIAVATATLHASIYYELRMVKEGVGPEQIAAVFD